METAGGLFLLGNYLNSKDSSKPTNNINKHDVSKLSSKQTSDNIYNSNQYKKSNEYVNKKAKQRFNNSMNTTKTGIVPDKYNQVLAQKKIIIQLKHLIMTQYFQIITVNVPIIIQT